MLNVVAELVTRRRLLHLPLLLLPLLRLVLDVRMLGLVAPLVVEWHRTSVPHARVAEDVDFKDLLLFETNYTYLKLCMAGLRWPRGPPALPCCCTGTGALPP